MLAAGEGDGCGGGSSTTSPAPSSVSRITPQIHIRSQSAALAADVVLDFEEL